MTAFNGLRRSALNELRAMSGRSLRPLAWSFLFSVSAQLVTLICNLGLARMLGRVQFGEWASIQNTLLMTSGIAQLSMALTATKYAAQFRQTDRERLGLILGVCSATTLVAAAVAAVGVLAAARTLAHNVLNAPHLQFELKLSVVSLVAISVTGYQQGALAGLERYRPLANLGVANAVVTVALVLGLARAAGLRGAVAGYAVAQCATWAMYHLALRAECGQQGIRIRWRGARSQLATVGGFAFPATLSGIALSLGTWLVMVGVVRSPLGFHEMAIYAAASNLRALVLFLPSVALRVSTSVVTNAKGENDVKGYRRALTASVGLVLVAAVLPAVGVGLLARPLLSLFGREFEGGAAVVALLLLAGVIEAVSLALAQSFVAGERMWANLGVSVVRGFGMASLTFWLAPASGAVGAAVATVAGHAGAAIVTVAIMRWRRTERRAQEGQTATGRGGAGGGAA